MSNESPTECVAANVRSVMARQRISQTELASALGMRQQSLSRRLQGKTPITVDEAYAMAAALGVNPSDVFEGVAA